MSSRQQSAGYTDIEKMSDESEHEEEETPERPFEEPKVNAADPPIPRKARAQANIGTGGREETSRLFGIPKYSSGGKGGLGDYSEIYPEDPYGAEVGENARVWRVYLDESGQFDDDMLQGFRDTLDVHLVFAALFSAVVTTFVAQTSQALQPDYGRISAAVLLELVALQRARSPDDVPSAGVDLDSLSATTGDVWVNALWFTTLGLSLATVLIAVLVKQWLQEYVKTPSGPPRDRALIRHMRYKELVRWKVPFIISLIPVLLHISLALFLAGLIVFLYALSLPITWTVAALTGMTYLFYLWTHALAVVHWQCSYRTPVTHAVRDLLRRLITAYYGLKPARLVSRLQRWPATIAPLAQSVARWFVRKRVILSTLWAHPWSIISLMWLRTKNVFTSDSALLRPPKFAGQEEVAAIRMQGDRLDQSILDMMFDSLTWLYTNSTNLSARNIISEACAGWPSPLALDPKTEAWRMGLGAVLPSTLHEVTAPGKLDDERGCLGFERWARSLCCIAWEPFGLVTERHGGFMPLFGRNLVTHEDWNVVAERMREASDTQSTNQQLLIRLLCLRLFYPAQASRRYNRHIPAPDDLLREVRRIVLNRDTRLAPAVWHLLLDYACRRMPNEPTILLQKPTALQQMGVGGYPSRRLLTDEDMVTIQPWLEDVLLLAQAHSVATTTRDGKSRTSLYRACEGPATLQEACDYHSHVKQRLTDYLCLVLGNDSTRARIGQWPQALAQLAEYLRYANQPVPKWLADACWTELQSLAPQYHRRVCRVFHDSAGSVQNFQSREAVYSFLHDAQQNFETIFVLYKAARSDAVGDPETVHTEATIPHRTRLSTRSVFTAREDEGLNTVELPIRCASLILELSTPRTPDVEKGLLLEQAMLVILKNRLLEYIQHARHAIHRHLVQDLVTRYIGALLGERNAMFRSIRPPLSEETIRWMASMCEPAHPSHVPQLLRYEEALRRLYKDTEAEDSEVWHRTLISSIAEVHLANATRGRPWVVLNRYRSLYRFAQLFGGEPCDRLECQGHSLFVCVNVGWLLEQGVRPAGYPDNLDYGPYAIEFSKLDKMLEEADAESGEGFVKHIWEAASVWANLWRPSRQQEGDLHQQV
ncbi:uncharacterized protein SCHCODRAFT_02553307 [Schizophyllum commune H4-8]|uniref:uncharacterized protein n=1 Tax=Schizophyllum commune (strain H4-8 / FGSC 9210) TaxID=578458 RepID=UPI00215FE548|nr:uncharacterized protein SCHCODRAFT_02553307 [Schizophyllum commune H4-8]KAI5887898.1 hypothetical protein SCHCODRAFT_02553307 [Schizophyllum commune H4-8]